MSIIGSARFPGPLMPFHSLLSELSLDDRLTIARFTSSLKYTPFINNKTSVTISSKGEEDYELRLGFLSYDFGDHPTSHLIYGLFARPTSLYSAFQNVSLYVYSYGKSNDTSLYRRYIAEQADKFLDVVSYTFAQTAQTMREDRLDVLLEMQLHTLGNLNYSQELSKF